MRDKGDRLQRGDGCLPFEVRDDLVERVRGIDIRAAQKRRFPRVARGDDEARKAVSLCRNEDGQQARDGAKFAAEGKLAQKDGTRKIRPDELFARL